MPIVFITFSKGSLTVPLKITLPLHYSSQSNFTLIISFDSENNTVERNKKIYHPDLHIGESDM